MSEIILGCEKDSEKTGTRGPVEEMTGLIMD